MQTENTTNNQEQSPPLDNTTTPVQEEVSQAPPEEAPQKDEKKAPETETEIEIPKLEKELEVSKFQNQNPIQLAWKDLEYKVDVTRPVVKFLGKVTCGAVQKLKPTIKQILSPQTAYVNPGQVLAIMGPSGS